MISFCISSCSNVFSLLAETYCKRLRVICPEHAKDPKIGDNDVCGYSLTRYLNCGNIVLLHYFFPSQEHI